MKLEKEQIIRVVKIIGVFLIIYLYYNFMHIPKKQDVNTLQYQLKEIEAEVEKARTDAAYLEKMKLEIASIEKRWNFLKGRIPSKKQFSQILEELAEAATGDNVYYVAISPEVTLQYSAIMIRNLNYEKMPIKVTLQCRYRDLGDYLVKLGSLNRLIKVEDIEVKADDTAFPLVQVELIVSTYVVSEI
ncbi:MAG: type 4a pilus biogenesis protein PilO [bacterium]